MSELSLVASVISSIIKCPVKTYDECKADGLKIDPAQILDLDTIYKKSLIRIKLKDIDPPKDVTFSDSNKQIQIFVKPLAGSSQSMFVDPSITVLEFKNKGCTIQVLSKVVGGYDFHVITPNLLNPSFHYDFRNINDNGETFIRGMELYRRPYGWKRIALNVTGMYGSDMLCNNILLEFVSVV